MKTTDTNTNQTAEQTLTDRCVQSCKQLLAGIEQAKNRIANEFQETFGTHGQLFQLALNEAEALAWQTSYPHLLFPELAVEKVQAVAAWQTRQESVQRHHALFAEAA
jgi:hypothetical protein